MIRTATFCAVVALLALTVSSVPPAAAQEDLTAGLRVESAQFVEVDLAGSVLRVRHEVDLRNQLANRTTGNVVERFYFSSFTIPVYRGAVGAAASRADGRPLPVEITAGPDDVIALATVDLQPDIYANQSASIVLTYELPTQPPRTDSLAQVNAAFATFPLFLSGDPGLADVEVRIPSGTDVESVGDALQRREEDGTIILSATDVADPAAWFVTLLVRDDEALVQRQVSYPPHTVTLQGWPGDDEWLTATEDLAARGLPALEAVIGYGWGATRQLDIVETVAPYVYGFGGWYQGSGAEAVIEVGDVLEPHVTLHELAHAWFDSSTFEGRWLNEALADETAALAMADMGLERPLPAAAGPDLPGALPLLEWSDPDLANPESDEQESYGYNTSWWIAHQITDEIGTDGLRDVLVAAHDGRSAYDRDPTSGPVPYGEAIDLSTIDWREMLDLVEDVGGSEQASDLWRTFVVTPDDLADLDRRDTARADYDELVTTGDGWLPPRALRDEMARWRFDDAAETAEAVGELLDQRDDLADDVDQWDIELPDSLRDEFEDAVDLDEMRRRLDDVGASVDAVDAAQDDVESIGAVGRVGLWFEDPDEHIDVAVAALESGSWEQAERRAAAATAAADAAVRDGILRIIGMVGLALLVAYVVVRLWMHRRRARAT